MQSIKILPYYSLKVSLRSIYAVIGTCETNPSLIQLYKYIPSLTWCDNRTISSWNWQGFDMCLKRCTNFFERPYLTIFKHTSIIEKNSTSHAYIVGKFVTHKVSGAQHRKSLCWEDGEETRKEMALTTISSSNVALQIFSFSLRSLQEVSDETLTHSRACIIKSF